MADVQRNNKLKIICPECDSPILDKNIGLGRVLECPACGTQSEIVNIRPLTLSPLEKEK